MKRLKSYAELSEIITSQMKRGMVTNAFLGRDDWEREISLGAEFEISERGLLVFRRRPTHRVMSFWINEGFFDSFAEFTENTVCEIPMRTGDVRTEAAVDGLIKAGFGHEFTRLRMASACDNGTADHGIRKAEPNDIDTAAKLMQDNFSPVTGCIPSAEELLSDIYCGGVLLYGDTGLLHHRTAKNKTELRHLCVSETARGQGIGEKLVLEYHLQTAGLKRHVWVRSDYSPAKKIYEKCGYEADGMISHVLIRR